VLHGSGTAGLGQKAADYLTAQGFNVVRIAPAERSDYRSSVVQVLGSVLMDHAQVGPGAHVQRSVLGAGAQVGASAVLYDAVVGDGAVVGARCELRDGLRVWPGVVLPDDGVRFSADV